MSDSPISPQVRLSGFRAPSLARRIAERLAGPKAEPTEVDDRRRSIRAEKARARRARARTSPRLGPRVGSPSAAFRPYQETAGRAVGHEPSRERLSMTRGEAGYLLHVRNSQATDGSDRGRLTRRRADGWLIYD
jgi:hypothetical protein